MSGKNRRILYSIALLVWSGVLLYFYVSGRIVHYLIEDFRPLALFGGLGLAVLGLFNLLTAGQQADCGHDHSGDDEAHEHDHEHSDIHPLVAFAIMVLPMAFSVAMTKDRFGGAKALANKGLYDAPAPVVQSPFIASSLGPITREDIEKNRSKTDDGYYQFTLMDLFFTTGDPELQKAIDGMKVETEGRWVDEKVGDNTATRKRLYRMFITCCAADARAIPIVLEFGKTPPEMPENGWVKVAGTMTFPTENGTLHPVLVVDRALAAEAPYEETFQR